jgi:lysophospholipase L1-like esterase
LCLHCGGDDSKAGAADAQASAPGEGLDGATGPANNADGGDSGAGVSEAAARGDGAGQAGDAASADARPLSQDGGLGQEGGPGPQSPCPTDGGACRILPLGDSITYGIQYAGAYRVELFQDALNAHQNITFVGDHSLANGPAMVGGVPFPQDNDGHSGWTIDQIAGLVPSPALQTNPDIVLLMIGTNDMYSQSQPVAQAPQRLAALLDKILGANAHALLVVAQITPLQNSASEMQVQSYNAAVPALVQARAAAGKHVALVDMHTGFATATMLSSDGVHPNKAGYDHMGDVWYAAVKGLLR